MMKYLSKIRFLFLSSLLLAFGLMAFTPAYVAAQVDPLDSACVGEAASSPTCQARGERQPLITLLQKVTKFVSIVAGICAIVVAIIAGVKYMVSAGDAQKAASGRNALIGVLVGLAIIALASLMAQIVLSNL